MENTQIPMEEKLGFFKVLKKAFTIPLKNPHFIIFSFMISIPLFFFMFTSETIFQHAFIQTAKIISEVHPPPPLICPHCFDSTSLGFVEKLIEQEHISYLLMVLFSSGILHFLELITIIAVVDSASLIYDGKNTNMSLKNMVQRLVKETRFKGPLITSIIALLLAFLILFGLLSLATYIYIASPFIFIMVLFGVNFVGLLVKYIEWSTIWNMGIVISILEEKQGDVALFVSSYLSRGKRIQGFFLALVFFVWKGVLRLMSLYLRWVVGANGGMGVLVAHISLVCLGNVMKWVVFVVYFYDCKKFTKEKNIDVEEGSVAVA